MLEQLQVDPEGKLGENHCGEEQILVHVRHVFEQLLLHCLSFLRLTWTLLICASLEFKTYSAHDLLLILLSLLLI